jgi:pimeloyl-ACP methyl ester carboxylesterase
LATRLDVPATGGHLASFRLGAQRDGAPLVLAIHGITSSSRTWVAVARELGEDAALVAVDLRGRGRSDELPSPFGIDAHVRDMIAVLDHFGLERPIVVGHSLGAFIAARLAARHPNRVRAAVLVDGGLPPPGTAGGDPQALLESVLGPAVARLRMRFETREAYRRWWRAHPAFAGDDIADADLAEYADHDLTGTEPELRSAVSEDAVRADAVDLFKARDAFNLTLPAALLYAPRGLLDDPNPLQPESLVRDWVAAAPDTRRGLEVRDVNHYTIALGATGARAVAEVIRETLRDQSPPSP